ncbi:hypothetical protein M7I_2728 [Glarea lozoyensis 74030]|uniref:Uncharacterized protein n=1 Tax=Glarea lozoyensis (strain ATCC 74030 / MF5533) TaxID=1104152 RepID=H0EJK1_GLAL7|nr:hypothetical protein M7I_2728 [Glarea lozoyensis 74030]
MLPASSNMTLQMSPPENPPQPQPDDPYYGRQHYSLGSE